MKIKLKELLEKKKSLDKLLMKDLPAKLAYRVNRITDKIISEFKQASKVQDRLWKKYGTPMKDNKDKLELTDEAREKFNKEWDELLEQEITLPATKVPFDCIEGTTLSALDFNNIGCFIEEPKEVK